MSDLHHSGRTTRMLEQAAMLGKNGHYVFVVALNAVHVRYFLQRLVELGGKRTGGDKVAMLPEAGVGSVTVLPADSDMIDWVRMRIHRAHPNCRMLVDHLAIETRYAEMLKELRRYDPPEPAGMVDDELLAAAFGLRWYAKKIMRALPCIYWRQQKPLRDIAEDMREIALNTELPVLVRRKWAFLKKWGE